MHGATYLKCKYYSSEPLNTSFHIFFCSITSARASLRSAPSALGIFRVLLMGGSATTSTSPPHSASMPHIMVNNQTPSTTNDQNPTPSTLASPSMQSSALHNESLSCLCSFAQVKYWGQGITAAATSNHSAKHHQDGHQPQQ